MISYKYIKQIYIAINALEMQGTERKKNTDYSLVL